MCTRALPAHQDKQSYYEWSTLHSRAASRELIIKLSIKKILVHWVINTLTTCSVHYTRWTNISSSRGAHKDMPLGINKNLTTFHLPLSFIFLVFLLTWVAPTNWTQCAISTHACSMHWSDPAPFIHPPFPSFTASRNQSCTLSSDHNVKWSKPDTQV